MGNALVMLVSQVIIVIRARLIIMKLTTMGRKCYVPHATGLAGIPDVLALVPKVRENVS